MHPAALHPRRAKGLAEGLPKPRVARSIRVGGANLFNLILTLRQAYTQPWERSAGWPRG
jgi:hypothetical protein